MSGNGVGHGLLTFAAHYVGVPTAPIAEQYALILAARERLEHAISLVKPRMAYVVDAANLPMRSQLMRLMAWKSLPVTWITIGCHRHGTLLQGDSGVDIDAARVK